MPEDASERGSRRFASYLFRPALARGQRMAYRTAPDACQRQSRLAAARGLSGTVFLMKILVIAVASGEEVRIVTVPMIHGETVIGIIQAAQSLHHLNEILRWLGILLAAGIAHHPVAVPVAAWAAAVARAAPNTANLRFIALLLPAV